MIERTAKTPESPFLPGGRRRHRRPSQNGAGTGLRRALVLAMAVPVASAALAGPSAFAAQKGAGTTAKAHDLDTDDQQMAKNLETRVLDQRLREPETAGDVFWRQVRRYPNNWTPVVETAATSRVGRIFLGFSRFPAARTVVDGKGATVVRWTDMRFVLGVGMADRPRGGPDMFTATVWVNPGGEILDERLGSR